MLQLVALSQTPMSTLFLTFVAFGALIIKLSSSVENEYPLLSTTRMNADLLTGDRQKYVVYSETVNSDCVWMFGGNYDSDTMYCLNMSSDSIYSYYNLSYLVKTRSQGAFFIGNLLYYYTNSEIMEFDFDKSKETKLASTNIDGDGDACMAQHPTLSNIFFFITPGKSTGLANNFIIYNTSSQSSFEGPSLSSNSSRFVANCVTHSNNYLYVIGGLNPTERIDLMSFLNDPDGTQWEVITVRDSNGSVVDYQKTICKISDSDADANTFYAG